MKVLGASYYLSEETGISPELLIRFALSQSISVAIVGCSSPEEVNTLAETGRQFRPLSAEEQKRLVDLFRPQAGRLAYYRGVS
jgi:aryl-alcohol dehydrogenase-like predicted oxidoreductase